MINKRDIDEGYLPIKVYAFDFKEFDKEDTNYQILNDKFYKLPSIQNIKNKITNNNNIKAPFVVAAVSRRYNFLPLKRIKLKSENSEFSIIKETHKSPLEFTYDAITADIYPLDSKFDVASVREYINNNKNFILFYYFNILYYIVLLPARYKIQRLYGYAQNI